MPWQRAPSRCLAKNTARRCASSRWGRRPRRSAADVPARLARLLDESRRRERELAEARRALAVGGQGAGQPRDGESRALSNGKQIGAIAFDGRLVDDVPGRDLRSLADDLK